jgi:Co/Zn/Cd efflux system component
MAINLVCKERLECILQLRLQASRNADGIHQCTITSICQVCQPNISFGIVWEAVERLFYPETLNADNLLTVSVLGLLVNIGTSPLIQSGYLHSIMAEVTAMLTAKRVLTAIPIPTTITHTHAEDMITHTHRTITRTITTHTSKHIC